MLEVRCDSQGHTSEPKECTLIVGKTAVRNVVARTIRTALGGEGITKGRRD